jgi:hypothetical protein
LKATDAGVGSTWPTDFPLPFAGPGSSLVNARPIATWNADYGLLVELDGQLGHWPGQDISRAGKLREHCRSGVIGSHP